MPKTRDAEDRWGEWVKARIAVAVALEEEVRIAYELGGTLAGSDQLAVAAGERLGDALAALLRDIASRPPPPSLAPLRDALNAYLNWRQTVNERMAAALRRHGWEAAGMVLDNELADGLHLYDAVLMRLKEVEQGRSG